MRIFRFVGIQSREFKSKLIRNWSDYPEGEAIYRLAHRKGVDLPKEVNLSEAALKEAGFRPCFGYFRGYAVGYMKKQPGLISWLLIRSLWWEPLYSLQLRLYFGYRLS